MHYSKQNTIHHLSDGQNAATFKTVFETIQRRITDLRCLLKLCEKL
jgi:arabinogalactan endo-1,4-beta-galactosidase